MVVWCTANKYNADVSASRSWRMSQSPILITVMLWFTQLLRDDSISATVLSSFTFSWLSPIHARTSLKHCSIRRNDNNLLISVISNLMYSWVSSAYRWKPRLCLLIISPTGAVYAENNRGPSTDPWGTPQATPVLLEASSYRYTHCDRSVRHDRIQASTGPAIP